jgi:transcriptional regulator with XRE-family HTH domain/REP element-mobilizing transposase RayT
MDTVSSPSFATLLKRFRLAAGLTQEALAEQANLSVRTVSDLERGLKTRPHRDTVEMLADALKLSEEDRGALGATIFRRRGPAVLYPLSEPTLADAQSAPLVGRSTELTLLDGHLGGAGSPVLLLAGEPGIGKTCLLQETSRQAVLRGWAVIQGGCQRRRGQEPYAPLLEALARHVRSLSRAQLLVALRDCVWLAGLLPELAQMLSEPLPALAPEQERRLMFDAGHLVHEALPRRFAHISLGPFMVMPNHLHGIVIIEERRADQGLGQIIGAFKSLATNQYSAGVRQFGWQRFSGRLWQDNYFEHIIRNDASLERIREYIAGNPLQWETDPERPL